MKFTLSWLKDHLDTDEPVEKLADKLTMIGLEVEHIEDKARALKPFTIAKVISAEQHPNADRLRVCMVDTGDGCAPVQVVCGAPNARAGLVSVFSAPRTFIPARTSNSASAPSAASRAAACCVRKRNCKSRKITTASWNCRPMRRSALAMCNGPGSA